MLKWEQNLYPPFIQNAWSRAPPVVENSIKRFFPLGNGPINLFTLVSHNIQLFQKQYNQYLFRRQNSSYFRICWSFLAAHIFCPHTFLLKLNLSHFNKIDTA
ncbi:hypothetical protein GDO78_002179 [Eleutherodactylus coqui]|uniref:Uncharacterized protein n=1 Tax=Eleutherodactylus coqui TaxID=57060 RepID=A0A8J6FXB1_ELECQ|nr:hypothetical protein GDO78_002179 [Eleutherodactylus coqui]